ncbi:MAG: methionyl-tRNA formyltransferase [Chloroflexia bacterium]|nr:methionyl-tRNA formyltransferase [Chloroflexia bacterium]
MGRRIVYMGTPEFACPALKMLADQSDVEIGLVVTQPDRAAGRGRKMQAPPVKQLAESLLLPVYQTASLRTKEQRQPLLNLQPDLIVVAAFGLILGTSILELPPRGCVNLHASILPWYRGASPISASILNGDQETGVTLMRMERGLDTGPMLDTVRLDIAGDDTTASLTERLSLLAGELLVKNLDGLLTGSLPAVEQPPGASVTRPLVKTDGWIDWARPASEVERHVRAMWSWPRAWTTLPDGSPFQIHQARADVESGPAVPGTMAVYDKALVVRCGDGWIRVERGQLAGGKPLTGSQLASTTQFAGSAILGGEVSPDVYGPMVWAVSE